MPEVLPELGALAAVAALLIIAAALWVLQGLIRNSLGRLPVVGGWINSNIDAALNDARNAVLSGASATWGVARTLFRWMVAFFKNPMFQILFFASEAYSFASRVRNVYLPSLENRVLIDASGWFSTAESYALGLYRNVTNYANGLFAQALVTASGWFTTAERNTVALFDTATADIANALVTAEHDAANLVAASSTALLADIRSAETLAAGEITGLAASVQSAVDRLAGDITSGVARAETIAAANAAALVGGIYTDLETWADKAVAGAWPDAAGELDALRRTLGADFPWLRDLLPALAGAGAIGLAGALIRSMATSQALTRLADECVVPNCRNIGGYGRELADLVGVVSTASLLAWMIEAAADPAGWARDTDAVLGPIASGATQAARTLLGI